MGVVTGLLLLPFTGPAAGFRFLLEQIRDQVEAAQLDEGSTYAELLDLSMRRTTGQLSDSQFAEQEAVLLERLISIRERREALLRGEEDMDDDQFCDGEPNEADEEAEL